MVVGTWECPPGACVCCSPQDARWGPARRHFAVKREQPFFFALFRFRRPFSGTGPHAQTKPCSAPPPHDRPAGPDSGRVPRPGGGGRGRGEGGSGRRRRRRHGERAGAGVGESFFGAEGRGRVPIFHWEATRHLSRLPLRVSRSPVAGRKGAETRVTRTPREGTNAPTFTSPSILISSTSTSPALPPRPPPWTPGGPTRRRP